MGNRIQGQGPVHVWSGHFVADTIPANVDNWRAYFRVPELGRCGGITVTDLFIYGIKGAGSPNVTWGVYGDNNQAAVRITYSSNGVWKHATPANSSPSGVTVQFIGPSDDAVLTLLTGVMQFSPITQTLWNATNYYSRLSFSVHYVYETVSRRLCADPS